MMKRGQMQLSFGMIFSIILIVIFISFAIWAIITFIKTGDSAKIGTFYTELQNDVNDLSSSSGGTTKFTGMLPAGIKMVCFIDINSASRGAKKSIFDEARYQLNFIDGNIFFYPIGSGLAMDPKKISGINIKNITKTENPYCIQTISGKVVLNLKNTFKDNAVIVER